VNSEHLYTAPVIVTQLCAGTKKALKVCFVIRHKNTLILSSLFTATCFIYIDSPVNILIKSCYLSTQEGNKCKHKKSTEIKRFSFEPIIIDAWETAMFMESIASETLQE
jgi:hypothetical protein